jgi:hypothetical protein
MLSHWLCPKMELIGCVEVAEIEGEGEGNQKWITQDVEQGSIWYWTTGVICIWGVHMPNISLTRLHLGIAPHHPPLTHNVLPRAFHPCHCPENSHLGHSNTFISSLKILGLLLQCQSFQNIFKFHWNAPSSWGTSRPPMTLIFVSHT